MRVSDSYLWLTDQDRYSGYLTEEFESYQGDDGNAFDPGTSGAYFDGSMED